METLFAIVIGAAVVWWLFKDRLEYLLGAAAVGRYSWQQGGDGKRRIQRGLLIAVPVILLLVVVEAVEFSIGWLIAIGAVGFVVWFIANKKSMTEASQQHARIGDPTFVELRSPLTSQLRDRVVDAVPVWRQSHRLDFWTSVQRNDQGATVEVYGPSGRFGSALVFVEAVDDAVRAVWDYERWSADDNAMSMYEPVLVGLRSEWARAVESGIRAASS